MGEIWKDVLGYEGKYQVSNGGKIKALNYNRTGQEMLMKLSSDKDGYLVVRLHKDGKAKNYMIHRLVAQAFIENPENKPCIDHISTDKTDNKVNNLRWVTYKENSNNLLTKKHLSESLTGKNIGNQYRAKKVFCENTIYDSITQCAEHYGVNSKAMSHWIAGTRKMPTDFQAKGLRYYIGEDEW